jgi:V/A-type H+-transporting ATPase subunit B
LDFKQVDSEYPYQKGQFYLHDGVIDPFGSLSRLKQHVIGKETREDHSQIMNAMVRLYSGAN